MVLRKLTGVFSIALVIGVATFAVAGVPDLTLSTATTATAGGLTPVMYNLPDGLGSNFSQAVAMSGGVPTTVSAVITLTVLDGGSAPVVNFSANDIWLEKAAGAGNFIACTGGTTADFNTNGSGVTSWANPLRAGGWSQVNTVVVINGAPLIGPGLLLWHNSADLTGNGVCDLGDIGTFATDYYGGADPFRSDMKYNTQVDLGDIGVLATGIGSSCP